MLTTDPGAEAGGDPANAIEGILGASAAAWNTGDLAGFLPCYEGSPNTVYPNTTRVVTGYTAIQKMYSDRSDTENAFGAGTSSMSLLRIAPLGSEYTLAAGRYSLSHVSAPGGTVRGVLSSIFRKTPAGWRITAERKL
jgi:hypothetical protein